jgi:hypothetical protein
MSAFVLLPDNDQLETLIDLVDLRDEYCGGSLS